MTPRRLTPTTRQLTVVSADATTTTECVWTGQTLVAERVSETRAPGGRLQTTVTDYRYLYGPDSLPLELIVTPLGGTPVAYTYQCDRAGSVVALTDATGAAVATYAYDPWGALVEAPTTGIGASNPLRYRGYYYDTETGLYYLPARYYDPQTARFLSPDPAPPSAGDPLSLNRYAYCVGDPVNADDPSGASLVCDGGGGPKVPSTPTWEGAAKSTVYGVTKWTSTSAAECMGPGMWALLGTFVKTYGDDGPNRVSFGSSGAAVFFPGRNLHPSIVYVYPTEYYSGWSFTRPDGWDWAALVLGAHLDRAGPVGWKVSAMLDAGMTYRTTTRWVHKDAGVPDILASAVCVLPGGSLAMTFTHVTYMSLEVLTGHSVYTEPSIRCRYGGPEAPVTP